MPPRSPQFWQEDGLAAKALQPLACLYQLGYRFRRAITKPVSLNAKVLCIGNLVAGGAGKTPIALAVGEYLKAQSVNACFLSKGYGGHIRTATRVDPARHNAADVGDEALLLAECLPVIVAKSRAEGARYAEQQGFGVIVMDDGFQNPALFPDLSFVVVDAAYGFGNGRTLPAGPLREPVDYGLARADAIILVERGGQKANIPQFPLPMLRADVQTLCPTEAKTGKWLAFSGIARPQQFFDALAGQGVQLAASRPFPDHHAFTATELEQLRKEAQRQGAGLITTAKDAVRLPADFRAQVMVAQAVINWHNASALAALLSPILASKESKI